MLPTHTLLDTKEPSDDTFPVWAIILVAIMCVLIITCLIVVAVIVIGIFFTCSHTKARRFEGAAAHGGVRR